jgi:hypothetical protein
MFRDFQLAPDTPTGYGVFDIEPGRVPPRAWLSEVWFTFNTLVNFLLNPCLSCESQAMVRVMVSYLEALNQAYPEDALMACASYYLKRRLGTCAPRDLEAARSSARALLQRPYWRFRDQQFSFSAFLDGERPRLPEKLNHLKTLAEA